MIFKLVKIQEDTQGNGLRAVYCLSDFLSNVQFFASGFHGRNNQHQQLIVKADGFPMYQVTGNLLYLFRADGIHRPPVHRNVPVAKELKGNIEVVINFKGSRTE